MKTMSVFLFGFKFSVESSHRYQVQIHQPVWPVEEMKIHPCKTYLGAILKAFMLARNRNNGWSENLAFIIFDMHKQKTVGAFKVTPVMKFKVKFARF